jgi:flagellar hook-associated protein 1 FlgK
VAEMGISGENASKMKTNSQYLKEQIDGERERVKGVSIDEEVSNMIKYQQAFNASARVITAADEMINKVVNGLGLVGR